MPITTQKSGTLLAPSGPGRATGPVCVSVPSCVADADQQAAETAETESQPEEDSVMYAQVTSFSLSIHRPM